MTTSLKSNQQLLFAAWIFYVCVGFRCAWVILEDGLMDGWLDYREYNLNANAIFTTIFPFLF